MSRRVIPTVVVALFISFPADSITSDEALESGERNALLQYLGLCSRFWKMIEGRLGKMDQSA